MLGIEFELQPICVQTNDTHRVVPAERRDVLGGQVDIARTIAL